MNKLVKDALILTLITLVAGLALGAVEGITKAPIAAAEENTKRAAYETLFPDAASFEEDTAFDGVAAIAVAEEAVPAVVGGDWPSGSVSIDAHVAALDASGNAMGDIFTVTNKKSYGGSITLSVGISSEGTLTGYMLTDISDTPGLGMKAKEPKFMDQFSGLTANILSVVKATPGEDQIEAISGATITSRAVTNAVDAAVAYYNSVNGGGE